MWNPFRTREPEPSVTELRAEVRALRQEYSELSDLYTVLAERFNRWDARQRGRAKRSLDAGGGDVAEGHTANGADSLADVRRTEALAVGSEPKLAKDELWAAARARGLVR